MKNDSKSCKTHKNCTFGLHLKHCCAWVNKGHSRAACSCPWCWPDNNPPLSITHYKRSKTHFKHDWLLLKGRIWPFNDSPCVFPNDVVLCEYEERPVDGEAVLPVGYGVVQSHGPGPLRLGLLHGSRQAGRRRVLSVPAAFQVPIPGVHRAGSGLVSKPSHSTKKSGDGSSLGCFVKGWLLLTKKKTKRDPPAIHWQLFERRKFPKSCRFLSLHIHKNKKDRAIHLPNTLEGKKDPLI